MLVLVNDREVDRLRDCPVRRRRAGRGSFGIRRQHQALATPQFSVRVCPVAVDGERTLPDPAGEHRAGEATKQSRRRTVGPLPGQFRGNLNVMVFSIHRLDWKSSLGDATVGGRLTP